MKTYFSTFISGTEDLIEKVLRKNLKNRIKILSIYDGIVVYKSDYSLRDIRRIRFFNNTFVLLNSFESRSNRISEIIRKIEVGFRKVPSNLLDKKRSFKIVISRQNQTISANRDAILYLERKIINQNRLRLNVKNGEAEFWIFIRKDKQVFFGLRMTSKYNKQEKGKLKPELANILCLASRPNPKDIVLDPFVGYGDILFERAVGFPFKKLIGVHYDKQEAHNLGQDRDIRDNEKIKIIHGDMDNMDVEKVDKIITDSSEIPFRRTDDLEDVYNQMLNSFYNTLTPKGLAVVLINEKEVFDIVLKKKNKDFSLVSKYNILVSGKKTGIYVLRKI